MAGRHHHREELGKLGYSTVTLFHKRRRKPFFFFFLPPSSPKKKKILSSSLAAPPRALGVWLSFR
jgi:hypothetical protein